MRGIGCWRYHVEETFEAAHAAGPEGQKCHTTHGHSFTAEVEGEYGEAVIDTFGWGVDFGMVKGVIRPLDHQNLNELFDFPPTSENIARYIFDKVTEVTGHTPDFVRLHEGRGNTMTYRETEA